MAPFAGAAKKEPPLKRRGFVGLGALLVAFQTQIGNFINAVSDQLGSMLEKLGPDAHTA